MPLLLNSCGEAGARKQILPGKSQESSQQV